MTAFIGKWKFEGGDDLDEIIEATGGGSFLQTAAKMAKPSLSFKIDEATGVWTSKTKAAKVLNNKVTFRLNEDFEVNRRTTKSPIVTSRIELVNPNKLVETQKGDPNITVITIVKGDKLTQTIRCLDKICIRQYKRKLIGDADANAANAE